MEVLTPSPENLRRAAEALREGGVVAYPTETVYGLGVDPFNAAALERLYALKGRDERHPVLLIVANLDQLRPVVGPMSVSAQAYATAFWPGPLSMVLPAATGVPASLRGPDGKVCVRWTSNEIASALCMAFGGAIVSTSANISGQAPARSAREVPGEGVAICIDGGVLTAGSVSTVFDPETGKVLRAGAVSSEALARVGAAG
jgi:L-threonylcarbamoyladenylate synthase